MGNSLATFDEEVFDFSNASSSLKKIIQSGELENNIIGQSIESARGRYPQYTFQVIRRNGKFVRRLRFTRRNRINLDMTHRNGKEVIRAICNIG